MANRNDISKELNELGSNLINASPSNVYNVPGGYFEGLAAEILGRIKAMESGDVEDGLGPFVSSAGRSMPYHVPAGYFDGLEQRLMKVVLAHDSQETPEEELENLSPLLSGLKKQTPYSVPAGYFESLNPVKIEEETKAPAKVISLTGRKWFRYAAAAMVIGIVSISAFLFLGKESVDPNTKSFAWVKKNMKNVTTESLDSFITITEKESPIIASTTIQPGNEVKEMMKNISDDELETFLNDVENAEPSSDEDLILN